MAKKTKTPKTAPRPSDAELAERLRGTRGRCFARQGNVWRDIVTGAVGQLAELAEKWNTECPARRMQDSQALDVGD